MTLLIEDRGAVRLLTLNRPEKHNALNTALTQALVDALRAAEADPAVNAVVLTGAGKSFCAGADTTEFSALTPEDPTAVTRRADLTTALHLVFSQMSKPVISAVRGNALGGGAGLAIACDMVVMSETVKFGYPELKHGIVAAVVLASSWWRWPIRSTERAPRRWALPTAWRSTAKCWTSRCRWPNASPAGARSRWPRPSALSTARPTFLWGRRWTWAATPM
jgi:enoyl-CoA hydratase/carnithine racemase